LFDLINLNLNKTQMTEYNWKWEFTPAIAADAQTIQQGGSYLSVKGGSWAKNTRYVVTATVSHKKLPQFFTFSNTTSFKTQEPPYGGVVSTSANSGYINDTITLYVYQWKTPNPPLNYLVFETENEAGTERGNLLTPTPLNQN